MSIAVHRPHLGYLAFVVQGKLNVKLAVILGNMFRYFYHISYYANCLSYYAVIATCIMLTVRTIILTVRNFMLTDRAIMRTDSVVICLLLELLF